MIAERIRAEFKRRLNKLDSNHYKDYPIPFIDDLFNLKALEFMDLVIGGKPTKFYKEAVEESTLSVDILSNFLIKDKKILPYNTDQDSVEFLLPSDYLHYTRLTVDTDCGLFSDIKYVKQINLNDNLSAHNFQPSKLWGRTIFNIAATSNKEGNSIYCYKDGFVIKAINLSYYKKPEKLFSSGYDTLEYLAGDTTANHKDSPKVNSKFSEKATNYIIDMMVYEIHQNQSNQVGYQMSQQKLTINQ